MTESIVQPEPFPKGFCIIVIVKTLTTFHLNESIRFWSNFS